VEHLPSRHEALNSNPSDTAKKNTLPGLLELVIPNDSYNFGKFFNIKAIITFFAL
jgi:hypothetical protein